MQNIDKHSNLSEKANESNCKIEFDAKNVFLKIDHLPPYKEIEIKMLLEKEPTSFEEGQIVEHTIVDYHTSREPKLLEYKSKLNQIKNLPDEQKPRAIVESLRRSVGFAYNDVVDADTNLSPEQKEYVKRNINHTDNKIKLSEIFETGYGVCRSLSMACVMIAKDCDIPCRYMSNGGQTIKNVFCAPLDKYLFKSTKPNEVVSSGHAWVEFEVSPGVWVPADPSTQIVGDSPEMLQLFIDANYQSEIGYCDNFVFDNNVKMSEAKTTDYSQGTDQYTQTISLIPKLGYSGPLSIHMDRSSVFPAFPIVDKVIDANLQFLPASQKYLDNLTPRSPSISICSKNK